MGDPVIKVNWASPYPGLRAFRTDESELFFGRRQQYVRMINILKRHNFLAVVGSSGCGKSSLVKAGLLPQLSNPKFSIGDASCEWVYVVARPGGGPYRNLAVELAKQCPDRNATVDPMQVERRLRTGTDGLMDAIYSVPELANRNVFVLIDQFEEVFRFGDTSKRRISELERTKLHDDSLAFVDTLLSTAEARNPQVYVAITMRSDSMGRCDFFQRLPEAVTRSQFLPPRMTKEQLLDAIRCPLEHFNGSIDDAVVSDLLEAMGDRHDQLPVVQHALAQIWKFASERTSQGESCCITTEDADRCRQQTSSSIASTIPARLAWVTDAISTHADVVFESLASPQRQRIARAMFCALCQVDNNEEPERRLTSVREVAEIVFGDNITDADVQETELVADAFAAEGHNFVVRSTTADSKEALDVSHESLLRQWSRLKDWVDTESESALSYRRLIDEVESGETCLTETHLEQAQTWLDKSQPNAHWAMRYDGAENPESSELKGVLELIEKSRTTKEIQAREEEEKLRKIAEALVTRRMLRWVGAAGLVALLFAITALYNLSLALKSKEETELLQAETIRQNAAHYWRLATTIRDSKDSFPLKSSHLFLRGAASLALVVPKLKSPSDVRGIATNALAASVVDENLIQSWTHEDGVFGAQQSGERTLVLTLGFDETVRLWDVTKPEPIASFKHDSVRSTLLSSDATRVFTWSGEDGTALLWDVTKPEPIQTFKHDGRIYGAQLSGDAALVLTWGEDRKARLWDVTKPEPIQTFKHDGGVSGAQLSGDAARVLTWGEDGNARLWDVTKPEPIQTFKHDKKIDGAQLSGDATRVLTWCREDGTARLWDVTKPELIQTFKHDGVDNAVFSGDATRVLTWSGEDGTVRLWDVTKPEPVQTFKHDGGVYGSQLSGDAMHVLTWGNGTARLWGRDQAGTDSDLQA